MKISKLFSNFCAIFTNVIIGDTVEFQFIAGHCKALGKEAADGAATDIHSLFPSVEIPYTIGDVTSLINLHARNATKHVWKSDAVHYLPLS